MTHGQIAYEKHVRFWRKIKGIADQYPDWKHIPVEFKEEWERFANKNEPPAA